MKFAIEHRDLTNRMFQIWKQIDSAITPVSLLSIMDLLSRDFHDNYSSCFSNLTSSLLADPFKNFSHQLRSLCLRDQLSLSTACSSQHQNTRIPNMAGDEVPEVGDKGKLGSLRVIDNKASLYSFVYTSRISISVIILNTPVKEYASLPLSSSSRRLRSTR